MPRVPCIEQAEAAECGLACLAMVAATHGREIDLASLRRQHPVTLKGMTLHGLMQVAERMNLAGRALRLEPAQLGALRLPAILHWDMTHFVVLVRRLSGGRLMLHDPAMGERDVGATEVDQHFSGVALELLPTQSFRRERTARRLRLRDLLGSAAGLGHALAQVAALSMVLQVYMLASPFLLQLAVDEGVAKDDRGLLVTLALGFALLALINAGAGLLRALLLMHVQARLGLAMGVSLYRHLLRLPLLWFERRHTGDLVARFASLEPVRALLAEGMVTALVDGVMALLTSVMVFAYSARLGSIVLGALTLYIGLRVAFYPAMRRRAQATVLARARENTTFIETARAIQSIKVFNAETGRLALWSNRYSRALSGTGASERLRGIFRALNDVLFGIENVAVVYVGASAVMGGQMSLGMLFAFMAYKQQFVERAVRLVDKAIEARLLDLHLERLADIAHAEAEDAAPPDARPIQGEIAVRGLGFRYAPDEKPVLHDVDFRIAAGEYVAITGPSGGGKTTLLKLLLGLLPATEGEVLVDGVPLGRLGARALRDHVGVVMQDDMLLSGSIADNIAFFDDRPDPGQIERCARIACIHDDIIAMPMGYETLIGDMGSTLSGGQRQRVLLARALYRRPRILVMDEGTSSLDPHTEAQVNAAVAALGLTRIIVAHRPETVASADRVLILTGGTMRGTPRDAGHANCLKAVAAAGN